MKVCSGGYVDVLSKEALLNMLHRDGRLGNLPFTPKMLQDCGQGLWVTIGGARPPRLKGKIPVRQIPRRRDLFAAFDVGLSIRRPWPDPKLAPIYAGCSVSALGFTACGRTDRGDLGGWEPPAITQVTRVAAAS